jgi:hypothetical protein
MVQFDLTLVQPIQSRFVACTRQQSAETGDDLEDFIEFTWDAFAFEISICLAAFQ